MKTAPDAFLPFDYLPPLALETSRLRLRTIDDSDVQTIFDGYASDERASKYMSFPCTKDISHTREFVIGASRCARGEESEVKHFVWLAFTRDEDRFVGAVGIGPKNEFTVEGGYILCPEFWGRGFATEMWRAVVEWTKMNPRVYRIEASFHPDNSASGRVMEKAGMTFEGTLRRYAILPNVSAEPVDVHMYAWVK